MTGAAAERLDATSAPLDAEGFVHTRDLLDAAAAAYGELDAYVEPTGDRISFAAWAARARTLAADLHLRGVRKGDVIALMLPAGIDYAVCYAASAMIGAVTTGLNPRLGPREVAAMLGIAAPTLVIRDEQAGLAPVPPGLAVLPRTALPTASTPGVAPPTVELTRADPVAIIFTSGTTGLPKGAWFDGDNLAAFARSAGVMSAPYDRRLTATPFAHAGYMAKLWDQLAWGITLVASPIPWSASRMYDVLRAERITVGGGVPTQWAKLLEEPGVSRATLPQLRVGVVATAPAPPDLVERTADLLGVPLVVRYAMTESPTICGTEPGDPPDVLFRTVGRPQHGMAVRLTDDDGYAVPLGQVGRVRVRGDCVMRGYWHEPALTAAAFDSDGYFISGDLGRFTPEGDLQLVGRAGDLYIRGGFNVHPLEVEAALSEHPGIRAVAVVGEPTPVIGETGVAFVVPTDPARQPTLAELREWCRARLADYKAPDRLVVLDELPLTAMQKTDRAALRAWLDAHPAPPHR
ncbi:class I adenylate-forming enzyme family protein [Nocardioides sp. BP30]|uniref:class I adenylate-forming enzyme family protein n=1 Tax=Nocardioides sp. BP30 TaxID=3036374 RepID=UPI00246849EC|nr:class I adenylate-forming enzyme family protein [Nocardioides sp. BP30]WGL54068.1 class I adenylate-forming enzyme family protein [Nocardioides sp. BP30]